MNDQCHSDTWLHMHLRWFSQTKMHCLQMTARPTALLMHGP